MFTGLIEGTGKIEAVTKTGNEMNITVLPLFDMEECQVGDSIAVNGVCLTAAAIKGNICDMYASGETVSRTTLFNLKRGDHVNLERALRFSDRLGGHLVSGHVDGIGKIRHIKQSGKSWLMGVEIDEGLSKYTIEKGSVAIDGVSLTINHCQKGYFEVNIIPETGKATIILKKKAGDTVNIETDILAKYIEKFITSERPAESNPGISSINMEMLSRFGFSGDLK